MNITDKILQEWSFRSPDGLASGYKSEQNIACLQEILEKVGLPENKINDVVGTVLAKEEIFTTQFPLRSRKEFVDEMEFTKKIKNSESERIYKAIKQNTAFKNAGLDTKYNKLSVQQALDYLNNSNIGQLFSEEMNAIVGKKGLGRGEYALLFLVKDAYSGGTTSGDLILKNQVIDVKEFSSGEIKFPFASIKMVKTKFYKNLFELGSFIIRNQIAKDYLVNLVTGALSKNFKPKAIKTIVNWIHHPSVTEVSTSVIFGLHEIGEYFKNEKKEPDAETAALKFVGEPPKSMVIQEPEEVKKKISQSANSTEPVKMVVEPLFNELERVTIPALKNLDFFAENMSVDEIGKDLLANTYDGGIIYLDETKYGWWKKNELNSALIFNRISLSGAYFAKRK
jgi:hypothetical protein